MKPLIKQIVKDLFSLCLLIVLTLGLKSAWNLFTPEQFHISISASLLILAFFLLGFYSAKISTHKREGES